MREIIAPTYFCQKTKERGPKVESHYHDDDAMTLSGTWCLMLRFSAVFYTICVVSSTVKMRMKVAKLCFFTNHLFLKVKSNFSFTTKVVGHKMTCFSPCESLCTQTGFQKQIETTKVPS